VTGVHGLESVTQAIDHAGEGLKVPALAALGDPVLAVILEGAERDQSVVTGAAAQDFGAGVADEAVAYRSDSQYSCCNCDGLWLLYIPLGCSMVG
jgi:hypothetical protein